MTFFPRWLAAWLLALLLAASGPAWAQSMAAAAAAPSAADSSAALDPEVTVPALRARLDKIPETVERNEDITAFVTETQNIVTLAQRFVATRSGPLADLNARLGELGAAPPKGTAEDPDITRQRAALEKERNALDADIRLARLVSVDAQQRASDLRSQRRALFEARLLERSHSPLSGAFWRGIATAWPADSERLKAFATEVRTGASTALRGAHGGLVVAVLMSALLMAFVGTWAAEHLLTQLASRVFPKGRLRRSLLALSTVVATVFIVGLAAQWAWQSLQDAGDWGPMALRLGDAVARFALFVGFVIGLGRALLAQRRPSWRLPPMADDMAARMAFFPWLIAGVSTLSWLTTQVNTIMDASLAATVLTHVASALTLTALTAIMVMRLRLPEADLGTADTGKPVDAKRTESPADAAEPLPERPLWVGLLTGGVAAVLIAVCVLVAIGYVSLASFIASQLVWTGVVAAAAYLLFKFFDDLAMALLSSRSNVGQRLQKSLNVAPTTLDQAAVVLSGVLRVTLFFYLVIALLAPLGTTPDELFQRSGQVGASLKVGQFELVPGALLGALGVLVIGFVALRIFKRWLDNSYLPSTTLEPGMRSSLTTLLGYVGGILVIASALSALGIGVERIAWVASALSVGIGFGLQAIVQNFISGLILLAERPVKVGDWVVLGTAEGDVRRINVRATEIQLGDRSTLIVPNSEFITKTVRNMTLANAEGRVLIRLPMPLTTDANRAREVLLAACSAHDGILPTPAASVTLDGIENGFLIFQVIAYVQSPRLAGGVRSDLLFSMLDGLKQADLPLVAYAAPPPPQPIVPGEPPPVTAALPPAA
jgi:potassium-dependent mechanosensitive channel